MLFTNLCITSDREYERTRCDAFQQGNFVTVSGNSDVTARAGSVPAGRKFFN